MGTQTLMTIEEAATYLRISLSTAYKLAQNKKIPAVKVGGAWRFSREGLNRWLLEQPSQYTGYVLVIDDDDRVKTLLATIILDQGYQVLTASTGEEALELMERQSFDLVFLDLVLPGMNGVDVLAQIKGSNKQVPVAVINGYGNHPIALKALALGPLVLVRKPFRMDDIISILDTVMKVPGQHSHRTRSQEF